MGLQFNKQENILILSSLIKGMPISRGGFNLLKIKINDRQSLLLEADDDLLQIYNKRNPEALEYLCWLLMDEKTRELLEFNKLEYQSLNEHVKDKYGITDDVMERIIAANFLINSFNYFQDESKEYIRNELIMCLKEIKIKQNYEFMDEVRAADYAIELLDDVNKTDGGQFGMEDINRCITVFRGYTDMVCEQDIWFPQISNFVKENENPVICVQPENFESTNRFFSKNSASMYIPRIYDYIKDYKLKAAFIITE